MCLKFSLYMAWLAYSSENVAVHSNDHIARALLNKREVWLKHSNSGSPMLQFASSEVLQMSANVISVFLIKHLLSTWLLSQPSCPIHFGVSVWCIFSQATDMKLRKLAVDYLLVQLSSFTSNITLIKQCTELSLFAVPTRSQSKLLVLHVEGQTGNSFRPPGSSEQQFDYEALKFSKDKWSSTANIRKPSELGYLVGTRKAPLLRITSSVLITWSNFAHFAWCANMQENNRWVTETAFCQELACSEPNDHLFGSKTLSFMEMQQIDKILSWKEEFFLARITGNYRMSSHAIWKSSRAACLQLFHLMVQHITVRCARQQACLLEIGFSHIDLAAMIRGLQGPWDPGGLVRQLEGKLPFKRWVMSRTWALELGFWAGHIGWLWAGTREDKGRFQKQNRDHRTRTELVVFFLA